MGKAEIDAQFAVQAGKSEKLRNVLEEMTQHEWFRKRHPALSRFLGNSSGVHKKQ